MSIKHPVVPESKDIGWVKEKLLSLGFSMPEVLSRIGIKKYQNWTHDPDMQEKTVNYFLNKSEDELDVLIRLFSLSSTEERRLVEKSFSPSELNQLAEMDLLTIDDETVTCDIALSECGGLLIATDSFMKHDPEINAVMPLIGEVYEFNAARSKKNVGDTLDLCTGSGVHGLLASRHSEQVICVDNNPRAIAFSTFNRALNNISNVEILEGDLFSQLDGKTFDLILANPPYVPSTDIKAGDNHFSGGAKGDVLSSQIIAGLPKYLKKDGLCQIIHLMICFDGQSMEDWVRSNIGNNANQYSIVEISCPVVTGNPLTDKATYVKWGVTNIKGNNNGSDSFYCQKDYVYPVEYDVYHLFETLSLEKNNEERNNICTTFQ